MNNAPTTPRRNRGSTQAMTERKEQTTVEGMAFSCPKCGARRWVYVDDRDDGDGCTEAIYDCVACGHRERVELPD